MKALDLINMRIRDKTRIQKINTLMKAGGIRKDNFIVIPDGRKFEIINAEDCNQWANNERETRK